MDDESKNKDFVEYAYMLFWNYEPRMDSAIYNFRIVESLINASLDSSEKQYFYKTIIITLAAILECTFFDFLTRGKQSVSEKMPNISDEDLESIRSIDLPKNFANYCELLKKYKILGGDGDPVYVEIAKLIQLRNRIHIQNKSNQKPLKEDKLWTVELVKWCGDLFKKIFLLLCEQYSRPKGQHTNPDLLLFPEPWKRL